MTLRPFVRFLSGSLRKPFFQAPFSAPVQADFSGMIPSPRSNGDERTRPMPYLLTLLP
jgi:hypothetical protein